MTRAFIVTLQVDGNDDMQAHADEIMESLQIDGMAVVKVVPFVDTQTAEQTIPTMFGGANAAPALG